MDRCIPQLQDRVQAFCTRPGIPAGTALLPKRSARVEDQDHLAPDRVITGWQLDGAATLDGTDRTLCQSSEEGVHGRLVPFGKLDSPDFALRADVDPQLDNEWIRFLVQNLGPLDLSFGAKEQSQDDDRVIGNGRKYRWVSAGIELLQDCLGL